MLDLIPAPYRIAALAAILVLTNAVTAFRFYHTGYAFSEAKHNEELLKAQAATAKVAEELSRREAERLLAQSEADKLARELEDAAMRDPNANLIGLGIDGVRRLNHR